MHTNTKRALRAAKTAETRQERHIANQDLRETAASAMGTIHIVGQDHSVELRSVEYSSKETPVIHPDPTGPLKIESPFASLKARM